MVLGQTLEEGPAAVVQSASMQNERFVVVSHENASDAPTNQRVTITETIIATGHVITEFIAGQVENYDIMVMIKLLKVF